MNWRARIFIDLAIPVLIALASTTQALSKEPTNFVVIFCDDLGYGDLGCFGSPTIQTPNLDQMAAEGMKWTQFYSASSVCTPSRAALLTGRLPVRSGMYGDKRRVLFPDSKGGLPQSEFTLAEQLKSAGYATACIGKWHLGHLPEYLPTRHGFDSYFGIPYSNDMDRVADSPKGRAAFNRPSIEYWNVPLVQDEKAVERPADQTTITRRYTEAATRFLKANSDRPFFLYLAHSMPHVPLFRSADFAGKSRRGLYGDVIEEIDWSVGQILRTLREEGLADNTLVVFTSDNGPWLIFDEQGGSAGPLRDGKGCTWDGGMREPTIMWWPGVIEPNTTCHELGSTMDLFATFHSIADLPLPSDVILDSYDLSSALRGLGPSARKSFFYYRGSELMAVRTAKWKMHFFTQDAYGPTSRKRTAQDPPLLFDMGVDPGEQWNRSAQHPKVVEELKSLAQEHRRGLELAESQLD